MSSVETPTAHTHHGVRGWGSGGGGGGGSNSTTGSGSGSGAGGFISPPHRTHSTADKVLASEQWGHAIEPTVTRPPVPGSRRSESSETRPEPSRIWAGV